MRKIESSIQKAFFQWVRIMRNTHPSLWMIKAVPNGSASMAYQKKRFYEEGMESGFPDVEDLWIDDGKLLFIEFKSPKTMYGNKAGKLSDNQLFWREMLTKAGHRYVLADSAEKAIKAVKIHHKII